MIYTLKNESITAEINTAGAELISLKNTLGHEYIWQGEEWKRHAPLLFPICGQLLNGKYTYKGREYQMRSHGFTRDSEFTVIAESDTSVTLELTENDETLAVYPFSFKLTVKYEINGSRLDFSTLIENTGKHIMPYMFGWHPAFTLGGNQEIGSFYVTFPEKKALTWHPLQHTSFVNPFYTSYPIKSYKYYLNEEEIYKNDTLIFSSVPHTVKLAGGRQSRTVTLSYSDNLPYLAIWKYPSSKARYICLEPWSNIPSDGETPENFDSRVMSRLSAGACEEYKYSAVFD